jgi:hypothetical protein
LSSLEALNKVLKPPGCPSERPRESDWQPIEQNLGFELPEDYKEFIGCYGTGAVDNFLWVFSPFSKNKHLNLLQEGKVKLQALRQLADEFGEEIPYLLYPDSNGLLPWGVTDNGDVLYWLCKGPPTSWLIVVNESRGPAWREFPLVVTTFLAALGTKELVVDFFPVDFPSETPEFIPIQ